MKNLTGMNTFLSIWVGQLVSQVGTSITRFALLIWAYEQTDSAMAVALLSFFSFIPIVLVSPFAGVWIDRLDRRKILWLADAGAGLVTLTLFGLQAADQLTVWHLYAAQAVAGAFSAFQGPAFTAVSTQLLPKEKYGRAAAFRSMTDGAAWVLTPFLAGLLLPFIGIQGIMLLDLGSFLIAITLLLIIRIPPLPKQIESASTDNRWGQFWQEMQRGFGYIWQRPGLLSLMLLYGIFNFFDALTWFSVLSVMILARTGGNSMALASIEGAFGVSFLLGGLLMSVWSGPKRKIHGFLLGNAFSFFLGGWFVATGQTEWVWVVGAGMAALFVPLIRSSNETIWQSKVPPSMQGRVLTVNNMAQQAMTPLGIILSGLLADRFFEPAMATGGTLYNTFSPWVGSGAGTGIAVMFLGTAVLGLLVGLGGYLIPSLYHVEDDLPDHDMTNAHKIVPAPSTP